MSELPPISQLSKQSAALSTPPLLRIGIAGFGSIGSAVVKAVLAGAVPDATVSCIAARDKAKCRTQLDELGCAAQVVEIAELPLCADIVLECAPAALLDDIVRPTVTLGKKAIVLSVGALLDHFDLVKVARKHGGQIIVPTGALIGLDAVSAAAYGKIHSVVMTTRKPIKGLLGAPFLVEQGIEIHGLSEPLLIFKGTAREAAKGFPANLNVAVALSLAGVGPDETQLEIWADPTVTRNTHHIVVDADSARLEMKIENVPSENPKTGRITALSVIATLNRLNSPLRVGT